VQIAQDTVICYDCETAEKHDPFHRLVRVINHDPDPEPQQAMDSETAKFIEQTKTLLTRELSSIHSRMDAIVGETEEFKKVIRSKKPDVEDGPVVPTEEGAGKSATKGEIDGDKIDNNENNSGSSDGNADVLRRLEKLERDVETRLGALEMMMQRILEAVSK